MVFPLLALQRLKHEPADDRALRLATELGQLPERCDLAIAEADTDRSASLAFDPRRSPCSRHLPIIAYRAKKITVDG